MDTGISRTQLITKPSLDDLLYTFINGSADIAVDKAGQVKLGKAKEAQIADFNRDGALDIKIVYDSGYEVILVDRNAFGSNVQAASDKAELPTASKKEVENAAFLSRKFAALDSELMQAQAGRQDGKSSLNFDSGCGNTNTEVVIGNVGLSTCALAQKKTATEKSEGQVISFTDYGLMAPGDEGTLRAALGADVSTVVKAPEKQKEVGSTPLPVQPSDTRVRVEPKPIMHGPGTADAVLDASRRQQATPQNITFKSYTNKNEFVAAVIPAGARESWPDLNGDGFSERAARVKLPDGRTGTVYIVDYNSATNGLKGSIAADEARINAPIDPNDPSADTARQLKAEAQATLPRSRAQLAALTPLATARTNPNLRTDLDGDGIQEIPLAEMTQTQFAAKKRTQVLQYIAVFEPDPQ